MHIEAQNGTVILKSIRPTFAVRDAQRAAELLHSLTPYSRLILDFTNVHDCHEAAFLSLMKALQPLVGVAVVLRGLTRHEARLLKYLGLRAWEIQARA